MASTVRMALTYASGGPIGKRDSRPYIERVNFAPFMSREDRRMSRFAFALFALTLPLTLLAADWPQWRGPDRNGIARETGLLQEWPEGGPKMRWKRTDIGKGYSTPAVVGGQLYVQTTKEKQEYALCLDDKTGKDIWTTLIGDVGLNKGLPYPGTVLDSDH